MTEVLEGGVYDHQFGTHVVNDTGVSNADVYAAIARTDRALLSSLQEWVQGTKMSYEAQVALLGSAGPGASQRNGGLFYRDRYLTPTSPFEQMRLAAQATEQDDIVGNVAETTESLAFSAVSMFMEDRDQQNVLNQWAADVELDARLREMWRQLFEVSQCYVATWWENKTYRVRGKTSEGGRSRRKEMTLRVPTRLTLLDPLKVVPVGPTIFGRDQLAWSATRAESKNFGDILSDDHQAQDEIVKRLIVGKYEPGEAERKELANMGIDVNNLWRLDPRYVFRHTLTRPGFQRFAPIRLRRVFELLDLKQQLRQMERAHIIGGPLRVDQRIATPEGWKPIGAAKVGDKVFSVDGETTDIVGVYPQGVLAGMHRVTFSDGGSVICDLKHPWTVFDRMGRERTIPLSLIIEEGLFDSNGEGKRVARHRIPMAAPLQLPEVDLPLDPYLVGYMLGDGSFTQSMPKITCAEDETDQPWREALPAGISVSQFEKRDGFCNQYGLKGSSWRYNEVTEGLRDIGLWGMSCADKFIPDAYLWASEAQRWAMLQGLCDSDGNAGVAGGVEFNNTSEKLVDGFVQLVQSLGGVAKKSLRTVRPNEQPCWRVWASLPGQEAPFRIRRKAEKWVPRRHPIVRSFAKIEPVEDAEAICIKTAREDGLFLTEDMIVTHNTNFIVLITKGTDQHPADPREVAHLQAQVRTVARVPVLVGDHRLHVEIVTPKLDQTLRAERFNTIDSRITATLYGMFMLGNYAAGASGDDSAKLTKVVARGMESRRHMLRRTLEANIFRPMYEGNDELESVPKLTYHPRAIALDFDANWADFLLRLREENELSRETILSQFDLDQAHEALLRKREQELYDDTFQTQVPFSSPNPVNEPGDPAQQRPLPRDNGGGRRNGGGRAPGSGQGQPPRSPSNRSDRGRGVPPIENMTLSITDADGKVVASVPMSAIQALATEATDEGDDHGVEPEGQ